MARKAGTFYVTSRVHEVPSELRGYGLAAAAAVPFIVAGVLRAMHVYQANGFGVAVAIPILLAVLATYIVSNRVVVGADAVSTQWLWRREVVPLREIARVETPSPEATGMAPARIRLVRHDGTTHTILVGRLDDQRDVLVRTIKAALLARDGLGVEHDTASLARGDRDRASWLSSLRAMSRGAEGTMRVAPFPKERLRAIIDDVDARALDRAAAAIALAPVATAEDRERIRIAAESSADPSLRLALERAIDAVAEDEAVVESLAALEEGR